MPYTPIDDINPDWPTYDQQKGHFEGAADALSQNQLSTLQAPVFRLEKTAFVVSGSLTLDKHQRLFVDNVEILPDESQKIRNHSPDGFAWGYSGSGPAQSALAICLHIFKNHQVAEALYQDFKAAYVAHWQYQAPFKREIDVADFLIDHRERLRMAFEWEQLDREFKKLEDEETKLQLPADATVKQQMPEAVSQIKGKQPVRFYQVGDLVRITHPDNLGVRAIVYEVYNRSKDDYGVSLITEDGRNLGGWESSTFRFLEFDH